MGKSLEVDDIQSQSSSSVAININNKLDAIQSSLPKYTIFKVHALLRKENELAYEPEILSIGPYHRGKPRLQVMEDRKLHWLKSNLEQIEESDATKYVEAMQSLEGKARQCYSESTQNVNSDEFVEMLLLDASFIIQFMRTFYDYEPNDPFFQEEWIIKNTIRDMLLFENQIPLFVLEELYSMLQRPDEPTDFLEFSLYVLGAFLGNYLSFPQILTENDTSFMSNLIEERNFNDEQHLLGLLHSILRALAFKEDAPAPDNTNVDEKSSGGWNRLCAWMGIDKKENNTDDRPEDIELINELNLLSIPSAAKLHAAGIEFKSKRNRSSPFDINFENGVMEIPIFQIGDGTESFYRNMIAYEQYNQAASKRCVGLHANLMDCLIDSAEDVEVLRSFGIVGSVLGEDASVSNMFNRLKSQVYVYVTVRDCEVHAKMFREVNAYCRKRRHRWMAKLRRDYFNSPWALISFLAALLLLVLTVAQTIFSVFSTF